MKRNLRKSKVTRVLKTLLLNFTHFQHVIADNSYC